MNEYSMTEIYRDGYHCGYEGDRDLSQLNLFSLENDEKEHWWDGYADGESAKNREDME